MAALACAIGSRVRRGQQRARSRPRRGSYNCHRRSQLWRCRCWYHWHHGRRQRRQKRQRRQRRQRWPWACWCWRCWPQRSHRCDAALRPEVGVAARTSTETWASWPRMQLLTNSQPRCVEWRELKTGAKACVAPANVVARQRKSPSPYLSHRPGWWHLVRCFPDCELEQPELDLEQHRRRRWSEIGARGALP
eukprot:3832018-Pleurochrysis_carterae.AAC.2